MLLQQRLNARLVFANVLTLQQSQRVHHPRVHVIRIRKELRHNPQMYNNTQQLAITLHKTWALKVLKQESKVTTTLMTTTTYLIEIDGFGEPLASVGGQLVELLPLLVDVVSALLDL